MENQKLHDSATTSFIKKHGRQISNSFRAIGSKASVTKVLTQPLDKVKIVADESTIHGVKEAFYSNMVGRSFWCLIFVGCAVVMTLQMQGLFVSFTGQDIGTRIVKINSEYMDVPAVYYCNKFWMPHLEAMERYLQCTRCFLKALSYRGRAKFHSWSGRKKRSSRCNGTLSDYYTQLRNCQKEYEENVVNEMYVSQVLAPQDLTMKGYQWQKPSIVSHPDDEARFRQMFVEKIRGKYKGSLYNYVNQMGLAPMSAVMTRMLDHNLTLAYNNESQRKYSPARHDDEMRDERVDELFLERRDGIFTVSLNGVCRKVLLGPAKEKPATAFGKTHKHLVLHYGAYVYELQAFMRMYRLIPSMYRKKVSLLNGPPNREFATFGTFSAVAMQNEPAIVLDKGMLLTSAIGYAYLKVWPVKKKHLDRRNFPCRSDWSLLDQAHCNNILQNSCRECCQLYLPSSAHYNETVMSNTTCFHGNNDDRLLLDVVHGLRQSSRKCPSPCLRRTFEFEVTYRMDPSELRKHRMAWKWLCERAYLAILNSNVSQEYKLDLFRITRVRYQSKVFKPRSKTGDIFPCTLVEYEQTDAKGLSYEEYQLHSLSEVASNFGGTLGLWTGASVMSFVQIAYVCCLRKCFRRKQRCNLDDSQTI